MKLTLNFLLVMASLCLLPLSSDAQSSKKLKLLKEAAEFVAKNLNGTNVRLARDIVKAVDAASPFETVVVFYNESNSIKTINLQGITRSINPNRCLIWTLPKGKITFYQEGYVKWNPFGQQQFVAQASSSIVPDGFFEWQNL